MTNYRSDVSLLLVNPAQMPPPVDRPRCQAIARDGRSTPFPSSATSSGRLFLDRGGRHQSPSPLRRHCQDKPLAFRRDRIYHRTAGSVLTVCVSRGDKRNTTQRCGLATTPVDDSPDHDPVSPGLVIDKVGREREAACTGWSKFRHRPACERCSAKKREQFQEAFDEFGCCFNAASLRDVLPNPVQIGTGLGREAVSFHRRAGLLDWLRRFLPRSTTSVKNARNSSSPLRSM